MYLKALELENFKSFVHKNRIELKEGFTAISGPNGSGKSNIGDAILFVLGPKSSKVIRANRLTDLIYDGGKKGKPADYCRVSLIFDNSDRMLPIDSNEVKLTRYVKKANNEAGYNSYFYINDEQARLQDFISLLEHAKISADGYNFVKQGDVTRIVEMTPMERRQILDDISGIAEFDRNIAKAENKKRGVEEDMEKIEVLMDELKNRLNVLEEERKIALRYRELEEKLKETKAKIAYARMVQSRDNMDSYKKQIEEYEAEMEKLEERIKEKEREIEELKKKKEEVDKKIGELGGEELKNMKEKIDALKIDIAKIKTNIENREDKISENREKIRGLKDELKALKEEIKKGENELKEKREKLNAKKDEKERKERILREKEEKIGEANRKFRELSEEVEKISGEIEEKRKEYSKKTIEFNTLGEKISSIKREIAKLEEEKKEVDEGIKDAEWRIKEIKGKSKSFESKRKKLNEEFIALKNRQAQLRKEIQRKQKEIDALSAEYQRLRGRMESSDPLSTAVNAILSARDTGKLRGIYGTIAELGNVDEKYELAIQIAAGNRLMSIVCEDDESAAKAIEYLKKNHLGRATFLPLNKMLAGRPRGRAILAAKDPSSHGFAIDLIKYDKKFEAAFWYVFGDTVVVDDLSTARKLMGGVRLVTLDGQLIEASGAMVGGSVEKRRRISMGNLTEIGEKLRNLKEERDALSMELEEVERRIDELLQEINSVGGVSTEDLAVWTNEKNRLQEKLSKILMELKRKNAEREEIIKEKNSIKDELEKLGKEIENLESKRDSLKREMEALIPEKISKEIDALRKEISSLIGEISELSGEVIKLEERLKSLNSSKERGEREIKSLESEIKRFEEKNEEEKKRMEELITEKKKYEEVARREEEKIQELVNESNSLLKRINDLDREITTMNSDKKVKEELKITAMSRMNEASQRYEEFRREYESYGIKVEKVESVSKLKKYEDDIQIQLSSMGNVNLKSVEEYDMEMERYQSLKDDYNSLLKEKKEIEKLVKELNDKKKYALFKVFDAINENFGRIYKEMSNGGDAYLELENKEDPFKGGLIIKVKPPGKGIKRLHSLSGGEKSLTALSFIFAVQQYDPSPIYLLDEVDMFLDGVNSEILGRIIKRNSRSAQFIVVSLRKATIKFADYIIGVTNRGDGISRVYPQPIPGEVSEDGE